MKGLFYLYMIVYERGQVSGALPPNNGFFGRVVKPSDMERIARPPAHSHYRGGTPGEVSVRG